MKLSFGLLTTVLLLLGMSACQDSQTQPTTSNSTDNNEMLQHTVYFYLNDDVTTEERQQFEHGLEELLSIEEIAQSELGIPAETEERDVTDHDFAYSIFTWFETMEDYEVYEEHPDHLEFIDTYSNLWADVRVYDSEIIYAR